MSVASTPAPRLRARLAALIAFSALVHGAAIVATWHGDRAARELPRVRHIVARWIAPPATPAAATAALRSTGQPPSVPLLAAPARRAGVARLREHPDAARVVEVAPAEMDVATRPEAAPAMSHEPVRESVSGAAFGLPRLGFAAGAAAAGWIHLPAPSAVPRDEPEPLQQARVAHAAACAQQAAMNLQCESEDVARTAAAR